MNSQAPELARWLRRLETFSPHEIDLGLDRVKAVLTRLKLPRPGRVLHVAGTNGKGSSVEMLRALLQHGNPAIGSYTSPHIHRFNERIRIDGVAADDMEIVQAFESVDLARDDVPLTYFEFATLAALVVFARREVGTAILEIGMGGRLDAVNAVDPDAGLITNISLDHCDWLGDDIEAIAAEKAGIMRRDKPVVFAARERPAAIDRVAKEQGAQLIAAGRDYDWQSVAGQWSWQGRSVQLDALAPPALAGRFQIGNAAGVLALVEAAGLGELLETARVNAALTGVRLDGRLQTVTRARRWLLDVAHNPAAAVALADTLQSLPGSPATVAIVGMLDDKDIEGVVAPLSRTIDAWIAVAPDSSRAVGVEELARRVANATGSACLECRSIDAALASARALTSEGDTLLVTGSFFLVGPALERLQASTAAAPGL